MPKPEMTTTDHEAIDEALKRIGDCIRRRSSRLDLSRLGLGQLPEKIGRIAGLTELDISHNRFTTLPPELSGFPDLTRLDLSHNPLATLPAEISQLVRLTRLDITHTPLTVLPQEIGQLTDLTRLYLDHNRLETLPPEIAGLANLTRLYLSHNALAAFPPEIFLLPRLTRLDLSHNRLDVLPAEIGEAVHLTVLELSHNPLVSLPPAIGGLAKLTVLKLAGTRLNTLPAEIGSLAHLTELDLSDNPLTSLPESLRNLENLDRLFLHGNPALQLSPAILGPVPQREPNAKPAPARSILDFHFGRQAGTTRPINEVKLVLLGRSGAGKTTVVQALRDLPFREHETATPSVALYDWTMDGAGESPVTAHVWDFPGDPVTHPLHPFFFSPRNLYLIVLTGRDHREREDAEYWLRMVKTHATDAQGNTAPVIIALNQWNVPGCRPEVDRNARRDHFPFIRGFVEMDCKAKKGIPALRTALFRELERMPWVREPFPGEWAAVRRALSEGGHATTAAEYTALCLANGVTEIGQQQYLADFLHHLGAAVQIEVCGLIRPDWLVRHLYPLLRRAELRAGILLQSELETTLLTEKDPAARLLLMEVLVRFGLALTGKSSAGTVWLLPHAQSISAPPEAASFRDDPDAIREEFAVSRPARMLLDGIITRRFDFIEESKERKLQWRHGVILTRRGARALIEVDPVRQRVHLTVTGPSKARREFAGLCQAEIEGPPPDSLPPVVSGDRESG